MKMNEKISVEWLSRLEDAEEVFSPFVIPSFYAFSK